MRKRLSVILATVGFLIVFLAGGIYLASRSLNQPSAVPIPTALAGSEYEVTLKGDEALEAFNRLHQKEFLLIGGAVAVYGRDHETQMWAAETFTEFLAGRMVADMHAEIDKGDSPFHHVGEQQRQGRVVHILEGMGRKHAYFQARNRVIWLSADPGIFESALEESLKFYPGD